MREVEIRPDRPVRAAATRPTAGHPFRPKIAVGLGAAISASAAASGESLRTSRSRIRPAAIRCKKRPILVSRVSPCFGRLRSAAGATIGGRTERCSASAAARRSEPTGLLKLGFSNMIFLHHRPRRGRLTAVRARGVCLSELHDSFGRRAAWRCGPGFVRSPRWAARAFRQHFVSRTSRNAVLTIRSSSE